MITIHDICSVSKFHWSVLLFKIGVSSEVCVLKHQCLTFSCWHFLERALKFCSPKLALTYVPAIVGASWMSSTYAIFWLCSYKLDVRRLSVILEYFAVQHHFCRIYPCWEFEYMVLILISITNVFCNKKREKKENLPFEVNWPMLLSMCCLILLFFSLGRGTRRSLYKRK